MTAQETMYKVYRCKFLRRVIHNWYEADEINTNFRERWISRLNGYAEKLIEQYASTKAEEVAIEFYAYMSSAPDEDINDKTIYEVFDDWFTNYKEQDNG